MIFGLYVRHAVPLQVIVVGLLLGSLFFDIDLNDANLKFSVIFFSMIFLSVAGLAAIPGVVAERNVIYRQLASKFYPPARCAASDPPPPPPARVPPLPPPPPPPPLRHPGPPGRNNEISVVHCMRWSVPVSCPAHGAPDVPRGPLSRPTGPLTCPECPCDGPEGPCRGQAHVDSGAEASEDEVMGPCSSSESDSEGSPTDVSDWARERAQEVCSLAAWEAEYRTEVSDNRRRRGRRAITSPPDVAY